MKQLKTILICLVLISCTFQQSKFLGRELEQVELRMLAEPDDNCVILYEHADYEGKSFHRCSSKKDLGGNQRNEISSIKLGSKVDYIELFDNDDFKGTSVKIYSDISNLKNVNFNDKVNSYSISPILRDDCVRFWQWEGLVGDKYTVCTTKTDVDYDHFGKYNYIQFGNGVSRVEGRRTRDFGNFLIFNANESKVLPDNRFGSLVVVHDVQPENCVWFYKKPNYEGRILELCHSNKKLINYNGNVKSFKLGSEVKKVKLFKKNDYEGDSREYTSDVDDIGEFKNPLNSVKIFKN